MKKHTVLLAGVAAALVLTAGMASAQTMDPKLKRHHYGSHGAKDMHPLTVSPAPRPAPMAGPADVVTGIGGALATPFNAVGAAAGPVGVGAGVVGTTIGGVTSVVAAPFAGLAGGPVGISPNPAPPLPIKARFAGTGAVSATFDEGFSQDVPVDKSGPIYMIDNTGHDRVVTPFSLVAFPAVAATSIISAPFRAHP
jgi:hypothetical protein